MIKDPRTFEVDSDWGDAGFEFVNWIREYERMYLISDGYTTLLMSDRGNGNCHFEGVVSTSVKSSEPIYKVLTLNIDYGEVQSWEMFGWYHHLGAAALAVEKNSCDMQDNIFNYALVSRSYEGAYGLNDEEIQWYKWNYTDEKWEMCERPGECDRYRFA